MVLKKRVYTHAYLQVAVAADLMDIFRRLELGGALGFVCCPLGMVSLPSKGEKLRDELLACLMHRGVCWAATTQTKARTIKKSISWIFEFNLNFRLIFWEFWIILAEPSYDQF